MVTSESGVRPWDCSEITSPSFVAPSAGAEKVLGQACPMGIGHKGHKDHKGKERTLLLSVWEILNLTGFEPIAVTAVLGAGDLCVLCG